MNSKPTRQPVFLAVRDYARAKNETKDVVRRGDTAGHDLGGAYVAGVGLTGRYVMFHRGNQAFGDLRK